MFPATYRIQIRSYGFPIFLLCLLYVKAFTSGRNGVNVPK